MNTEVICAIISAIGVLLSSLLSFFVSKSTAKSEIKKMQLTWEREDNLSHSSDFAQMIRTVSLYCNLTESEPDIVHSQEYAESIALVDCLRSTETGDLAQKLDQLRDSFPSDLPQIRKNLDTVIRMTRVS